VSLFAEAGAFVIFLGGVTRCLPGIGRRRTEIIRQAKRIGNDSLLLIFVISVFTGLVTAVQATYQTSGYIPIRMIGVMVGKSAMIELGPVLTALVLSGRVGASLAAEIGTMRVSEQLDALETLAIDPADYLYMPRIVAGALMVPLLTVYSIVFAIFSAFTFTFLKYGMSAETFFLHMRNYFQPSDIWGGLVKSFFFGLIITSVGCHVGSRAGNGAEGVGRAATQTVVWSSILILIMDFFVAFVLFGD
jgi:phospholipid/cholesterol/gamma-HCH transport system permease protein